MKVRLVPYCLLTLHLAVQLHHIGKSTNQLSNILRTPPGARRGGGIKKNMKNWKSGGKFFFHQL